MSRTCSDDRPGATAPSGVVEGEGDEGGRTGAMGGSALRSALGRSCPCSGGAATAGGVSQEGCRSELPNSAAEGAPKTVRAAGATHAAACSAALLAPKEATAAWRCTTLVKSELHAEQQAG